MNLIMNIKAIMLVEFNKRISFKKLSNKLRLFNYETIKTTASKTNKTNAIIAQLQN